MALEAGTRLGHYEVVSSLGAGGMGEVYRAKDTKLGREVAIKLLLDEVSKDPDRLARFEREARFLASLNHNNIATLYGFEKEGDTSFLVMELVEGETLAERIKRGTIPVDEALPLFLQIAEGLEAAHEKGVIHRDLKPANIKVSEDGNVKILDFGLAKAMAPPQEPAAPGQSQSPTLTLAATQRGEILGTAAYMAPEQASGKTVDERADIWAFGVCLFEALSGKRAFQGEDAPNTLAAVLRDDPELDSLPADVPSSMKSLLQLCLAKKRRDRLHDIADARLLLQKPGADGLANSLPTTALWRSTPMVAALGVVTVVTLATLAWLVNRPSAPMGPSLHLDVKIAEADGGAVLDAVLSPDGCDLAYVVHRPSADGAPTRELYVRQLDQLEGRLLASGSVFQPFFSPDGDWVAFFTDSELRKVQVSGGAPQTVTAASSWSTGTWTRDGTIVFNARPPGGLVRVSANGGEPELMTELAEGEHTHRSPQLLPGGKALLFTSFTTWQGSSGPSSIEALNLQTRERSVVRANGSHGRYLPTGQLVFRAGEDLFAVAFDLKELTTKGSAVPIQSGVFGPIQSNVLTLHNIENSGYDLSDSGSLVYLSGGAEEQKFPAVWVDLRGDDTPLLSPGLYGSPQLSPDGSRLAVTELRDGNVDIWVYDLERGTETRLTDDSARDDDVAWSPDGETLAFNSERNQRNAIYETRADGSGEIETLIGGAHSVFPSSYSPDGRFLAYGRAKLDVVDEDVWILPLDGQSEPYAFLDTQANESMGMFSPDGRWIAYESDVSGIFQIYVRPFPDGAGRVMISTNGGRYPKWSADGRALFFGTGSHIARVLVKEGNGVLRPGIAEAVLDEGYLLVPILAGEPYPGFDVAGDGRRFVVFPAATDSYGTDHVTLVTNWFEELERLVPTD